MSGASERTRSATPVSMSAGQVPLRDDYLVPGPGAGEHGGRESLVGFAV